MSQEKCPLLKRIGIATVDIPKVCRFYCENIWEEASNHVPDSESSDVGNSEEDPCPHFFEEHSKDLLGAEDAKRRFYVVIDRCMECGDDVSDSTYRFNCANPY